MGKTAREKGGTQVVTPSKWVQLSGYGRKERRGGCLGLSSQGPTCQLR